MSLVRHRVPLPGGDLQLLQPTEAAELPDDGAIEWDQVIVRWRARGPMNQDYVRTLQRGYQTTGLRRAA